MLLRYQRLASALSLAGLRPDPLDPADRTASRSARRPPTRSSSAAGSRVLQGTGLGRPRPRLSAARPVGEPESLAFTQAQATAALQAIRDAIAKLPAPTVIAVTGASDTAPITITTALANGLQTGAQVSITGVLGQHRRQRHLHHHGHEPDGVHPRRLERKRAWTSGGTITINAYDPTTIQTTSSPRSRPRRRPPQTSSRRSCSQTGSCRSIRPPSACCSPRPPASTRPSSPR